MDRVRGVTVGAEEELDLLTLLAGYGPDCAAYVRWSTRNIDAIVAEFARFVPAEVRWAVTKEST